VYAFEVKLDDSGKVSEEELERFWGSSAGSGYNRGCIFMFQPVPGVLIGGHYSYILPPGAVALKKQ
jgi:hypothetical protein